MPQLTWTGKSSDENTQKGCSKMERKSEKIKRRYRKRKAKLLIEKNER
jgi:hypothetical protein